MTSVDVPAGLLTPDEAGVLASVDTGRLVDLLSQLITVPSVSGSTAEIEIQHLLAHRLEHLGLAVDLWSLDLPALCADPDFPGWEKPRDEAWGLVGTSGEGHPALVLQGHVDVVPAGDPSTWRGDAFTPRVSALAVTGRGACDMKAGIAAALIAIEAVQGSGVGLARPFALHLVAGEEDGGLGAFATLRRGHTGEACLIPEPTTGTVTTANSGALTFEITVPGSATHASTAWAGVSAFDAFLPIYAELTDLGRRRNRVFDPLMSDYPSPHALSVGVVRSGDWASTVPDRLTAQGRLGVRIDEDPAQARVELHDAVSRAAVRDPWLRKNPPTVTWHGGQFASGRYDHRSNLFDTVRSAHADVSAGPAPRERGAPYGSDLRLYAAAGIPTLHYGPGDVRLAHGPNESVSIAEAVQSARVLALVLLRSCGAGAG